VKITQHRVLKLYRSGIHSARGIARRLGQKSRKRNIEVQRILSEARLPIRKLWSNEEREILRQLYPTTLARMIACRLNQSLTSVYREANKLGLHPLIIRGPIQKGVHFYAAGEFKKGHQTWNKGMKGLKFPGSERTQFKKGHTPGNTLYDGAITIHTDWNGRHDYRRYKWIRLGKMKWKMLHVVIWEHFYGSVPSGHIVVFANGDQMNCRLDNLRCISRAQHAAETRNKDGYIAKCLAAVHGFGKGGYDRDLYVELLKHPELLDAKRKELQLRRLVGKEEDALA
jgi:hypothetical protein